MYTHNSIHILIDEQWFVQDVSDIKFEHFIGYIEETRVALVNPDDSFPGELRFNNPVLDLDNATPDDTINSWLLKNGNRHIADVHPLTEWDKSKHIQYFDPLTAGYKITPINPNYAPDSDIPIDECDDLFLQKEGVTGTKFASNCLVTVNGLVHRVKGNSKGAFVMGGYRSIVERDKIQIGAISFEAVSDFDCYSLANLRITDVDDLRKVIRVDVGVDLSSRKFSLVLGGFLYIEQSFYRQVSPTEILINYQNIPLIERHFRHWSVIRANTEDTHGVVISDILDNNYLVELMSSDSTFLIAYRKPFETLYCNKLRLENTFLCGKYIVPKQNSGIPYSDTWEIAELYQWTNGDNVIASTNNYLTPNYYFYGQDTTDVRAVTNQKERFAPNNQSVITLHDYYLL